MKINSTFTVVAAILIGLATAPLCNAGLNSKFSKSPSHSVTVQDLIVADQVIGGTGVGSQRDV